jgi:hypothetical protein
MTAVTDRSGVAIASSAAISASHDFKFQHVPIPATIRSLERYAGPITVAARSKARTVFVRSNAEIVHSNPT